jgi:hypothetical protein
MSDLVALAREYVTLSDQLETVRAKIKLAVLNGGAGPPEKTPPGDGKGNFPQPRVRAKRARSKTPHPNAKLAAEAEGRILEVIRSQPGIRTAEIARAMDAKVNTTTQRLGRMLTRSVVVKSDQGGYALPA